MGLRNYTMVAKFSRDGRVTFRHNVENSSGAAQLPVDDELARFEPQSLLRETFYRATSRLIVHNQEMGDDFEYCTCVHLSPRFVMTTDHSLYKPFSENQHTHLTKTAGDVSVVGHEDVQMPANLYTSALETEENIPVYTTNDGTRESVVGSNDVIFLRSATAGEGFVLVPFAGTLSDLSGKMLCSCHYGDPESLEHQDETLREVLDNQFERQFGREENMDKTRLIQTWEVQCEQALSMVGAMKPPFWTVGRARVGESVPAALFAKKVLENKEENGENEEKAVDADMFDETRVIQSNYDDHGLFCTDIFFCRGGSGCGLGFADSQTKKFDLYRYAEMVGWCLGRGELYERNLCGFVGSPSFVLWYTIVVVEDWASMYRKSFPFAVPSPDRPDMNEFFEHLRNYVTVNRSVILKYSRVGDEIARRVGANPVCPGVAGHWAAVKRYLGIQEQVRELAPGGPRFIEP